MKLHEFIEQFTDLEQSIIVFCGKENMIANNYPPNKPTPEWYFDVSDLLDRFGDKTVYNVHAHTDDCLAICVK